MTEVQEDTHDEAVVIPIFPKTENYSQETDIDFDIINCHPVGDVVVVDDSEILKPTIEINGDDSYLAFPIDDSLQYLALQLKNVNRFMKIVLRVRDSEGKTRVFTITNKRTTIYLKNNLCQLPMNIGEGWQYINVDLEDIVSRCFGTSYVGVVDVIVHGSLRIGKIYFQDREYADVELPPFLRLLAD
mmetsp:Transcript_5142/g.7866  ORF Transcript_5142/g.7866 Transcript_5142/m.7866 type:complete len:187 (-) Transcript_5142:89-649(-)